MKVHGAVFSTATQKMFACLYEKELDCELVPVDMRAGHHKKEPFISLNVRKTTAATNRVVHGFHYLIIVNFYNFCLSLMQHLKMKI